MEKSVIPAEATSYGSNGEQLYWYVIGRSLYIKGSGIVKNFYEVGYNSSIHAIVIEDDVWLHQKVFTGDETLRYLVVPDDRMQYIKRDLPDYALDDDWPDNDWEDCCRDYPNLMVLRKGKEIELVYASPKLVDVVIPEGITTLGESCFGLFEENYRLESVIIPGSVTEFGWNVFYGCRKLKNVVIHAGPSIIGSGVFAACEQLTNISIPDTVTVIESGAFSFCSALKTIHLPSNLLKIGREAFAGTSISYIRIPDSVVEIGSDAFGDIKNVEYNGSVPEAYDYDQSYYWPWGSWAINGISARERCFCLSSSQLFRLVCSVIWNYNRNRKNEFQEGIVSNAAQFLHTILFETYKAEGQEISVNDFSVSRKSYSDGRHLVYVMLPRIDKYVVRDFAAVYRWSEQGVSDFATYRVYNRIRYVNQSGGSIVILPSDVNIICADANGLFYSEWFHHWDDCTARIHMESNLKKVEYLNLIEDELLDLHSKQFQCNME